MGVSPIIVVEGPDGSGKSSLIRRLAEDFGLRVHEKASDSVTGPKGDMSVWAYRDVTTQRDHQLVEIYDRHPLISQYIYGPIAREYLEPNMQSATMHLAIRMLAKQCLVIMCLPPVDVVQTNVAQAEQMAGVDENITRIYHMYCSLRMFWPSPANLMMFDYTQKGNYDSVVVAANLHVAHWGNERMKNVGRL